MLVSELTVTLQPFHQYVKPPAGFCLCTCGQRTSVIKKSYAARGEVRGRHRLFVANHHRRYAAMVNFDWVVDPETGCWLWAGGTNGDGYGLTAILGTKNRSSAHIVVYEDRVGPVPEGKWLDHLCETPLCVNPAHLEPVPPAVNTRRGNRTRLDEEKVAEMRRIGEMVPCVEIRDVAERFGVSPHTVANIMAGLRWG